MQCKISIRVIAAHHMPPYWCVRVCGCVRFWQAVGGGDEVACFHLESLRRQPVMDELRWLNCYALAVMDTELI